MICVVEVFNSVLWKSFTLYRQEATVEITVVTVTVTVLCYMIVAVFVCLLLLHFLFLFLNWPWVTSTICVSVSFFHCQCLTLTVWLVQCRWCDWLWRGETECVCVCVCVCEISFLLLVALVCWVALVYTGTCKIFFVRDRVVVFAYLCVCWNGFVFHRSCVNIDLTDWLVIIDGWLRRCRRRRFFFFFHLFSSLERTKRFVGFFSKSLVFFPKQSKTDLFHYYIIFCTPRVWWKTLTLSKTISSRVEVQNLNNSFWEFVFFFRPRKRSNLTHKASRYVALATSSSSPFPSRRPRSTHRHTHCQLNSPPFNLTQLSSAAVQSPSPSYLSSYLLFYLAIGSDRFSYFWMKYW